LLLLLLLLLLLFLQKAERAPPDIYFQRKEWTALAVALAVALAAALAVALAVLLSRAWRVRGLLMCDGDVLVPCVMMVCLFYGVV